MIVSDETIKRIAEEVSPTIKQANKLLKDQQYSFKEQAIEWAKGEY